MIQSENKHIMVISIVILEDYCLKKDEKLFDHCQLKPNLRMSGVGFRIK